MSTPECKSLPPPFSPDDSIRQRPLAGGSAPPASAIAADAREIGGPCGPEPTRFGDWEKNGRCIDF